MNRRTPLYSHHQALKGMLVPFGGWDMPLHYGSQVEEHHFVRQDCGVFDVSHMRVLDLHGAGVKAFLQKLLANDVAKLTVKGQALYGCMLNPAGGVIDDLITYYVDDTHYRLVVNAGTADTDLAWIQSQCDDASIEIKNRTELGLLAIQGPNAMKHISHRLAHLSVWEGLKTFHSAVVSHQGTEWFVGRTGYTGEDGFEVMGPAAAIVQLWEQWMSDGVHPIGLGARDTLRLEAGMNLYGQDMDASTTPLESGLSWTVAMADKRAFIGREALELQRAQGVGRRLIGLLLKAPGVLRAHQKIFANGVEVGEITSGSFSPTLQRSIALARISSSVSGPFEVDIRNKRLPVAEVKPNFVRKGKAMIELDQ
jgi:aminomethyltransferase